MDDENEIKVITILSLAVILIFAVIGLTLVALFTDRDVWKAEALTFGGVVLLAGIGGFSWWQLRRRKHWTFTLDHDEIDPISGTKKSPSGPAGTDPDGL